MEDCPPHQEHQKFLSNTGEIISSKGLNQIVHISLRVENPFFLAAGNAPGLFRDWQELDTLFTERSILPDACIRKAKDCWDYRIRPQNCGVAPISCVASSMRTWVIWSVLLAPGIP